MKTKLPLLPAMRCDKGCGDCCGVVPITPSDKARIVAYVEKRGIVPRSQGSRCPLYLQGECSVYPVRPRVCVAFGHSWKLDCPRGYNENVKDERALYAWVLRGGVPTTTIHEAFGVPVDMGESLMRAIDLRLKQRW